MLTPNLQPQPKRISIIKEARQQIAEGNFQTAIDTAKQLTKGNKPDPEALFVMGLAAERLFNAPLALEYAKQSLGIYDHQDTRLLLARVHRMAGDTDKAVEACDTLLAKLPGKPNIISVKAGALEEGGRFKEAREILEPLVSNEQIQGLERFLIEFEWVKILVQFKEYDDAVVLIDQLNKSPHMNDGMRVPLHHLKAKALDRSKHYSQAAEAAEVANSLSKVDFDPDLYSDQVTILTSNWSREQMDKYPTSKCLSELPVFVAGMPRSGTSLIDQIIDAHPSASGVGELASIERFASELSRHYDSDLEPPDCFGPYAKDSKWTKVANDYVRQVKKLAPPSSERVVNKALGNNKLVGLLAKLFPNTRIIHAIRDPRDVAISCFMGGFNNNLHAWTTQVDWVAHSWNQSIRMMNHWKEATDIPILDVHYERLVADPENEMPRIIEFLGLEWDDACRDFYKSKRTVRTLSYDQVNRPLYTSSSGRHKNYADLIEGVEFPTYDPFADPPKVA